MALLKREGYCAVVVDLLSGRHTYGLTTGPRYGFVKVSADPRALACVLSTEHVSVCVSARVHVCVCVCVFVSVPMSVFVSASVSVRLSVGTLPTACVHAACRARVVARVLGCLGAWVRGSIILCV